MHASPSPLDDAIAACLAALRARCSSPTPPPQALREAFTIEVPPPGLHRIAMEVTPAGPPDGKWVLQVTHETEEGVSAQRLTSGSWARVVDFLAQPGLAKPMATVVRALIETDFHTGGLPEYW